MAKIFNTEVDIVPEHEVIRQAVTNKNYVAWIGAGTSVEAKIKTAAQICEDLRKEMASFAQPADEKEWARTELNWDDMERRYSTCLKKYGSDASRVRYFRQLIQDLPPVFSHHAVSLLMQAGFLKKTCLTTNFDKLIEIAFAQQGSSECQPIRSEEEARFWRQEEDKYYVIKLHGDYDTHNILNTNDETVRIPKQLHGIGLTILKQSGLIVVGSSGYEDSVVRFFNDVLDDDSTALNMGLFWGVYVDGPRQTDPGAVEERVISAIKQRRVSQKIVELMARKKGDRPCSFFPLWGAGNFFFKVVQSTEYRSVIGRAERYLDHKMRLQHIFTQGGLTPQAILRRLEKLDQKEQSRTRGQDLSTRAQTATRVWKAVGHKSKLSLEILYGDITSRSLMDSGDPLLRSAVTSPEDNFVSASGGVALALLRKAGQHTILNELSKFSKVEQGNVVVTSGGELPVNYIFHAAATQLAPDGASKVSPGDIFKTMNSVFEAALSLQVTQIFVPLIGSGEGIRPVESLEAILRAVKQFDADHPTTQLHLSIVILDEGTLGRKEVGICLNNTMHKEFVVENTVP